MASHFAAAPRTRRRPSPTWPLAFVALWGLLGASLVVAVLGAARSLALCGTGIVVLAAIAACALVDARRAERRSSDVPAPPPTRHPVRRTVWLNALAFGLGTAALPARAQPAPDTLTAALRYEDVAVAVARDAARAATSWRRLLPKVRAFASASARGFVFTPADPSGGLDPYAAALARWPGDTWGLTLSWDLDQALDDRTRRAARGAVALAEARRALTRARVVEAEREGVRRAAERAAAEAARAATDRRRRADEAAALDRRAAALVVQRPFADAERAARHDLTRAAELAHRMGTGAFADLVRARLALLDADRALARLDADAADVAARRARLTASPDASPPPPPNEDR